MEAMMELFVCIENDEKTRHLLSIWYKKLLQL